jgi:cell division protein FtsN
MASRRRRWKKSSHQDDYPGWVWMLLGLVIGFSVTFAIYINDRTTEFPVKSTVQKTSNIDNNNEQTKNQPEKSAFKERFVFYDMLPKFEIIIPEQALDVQVESDPQAVVQPGFYVLQAGSFIEYKDADQRRAKLAMQGIESKIQRVTINDKTHYRVRIGPIDDLNKLNLLQKRLHQAQIDIFRIRLGD